MTGTYRYIRHEDIPEWESRGWHVVAQLHLPHSNYSVLMRSGTFWQRLKARLFGRLIP